VVYAKSDGLMYSKDDAGVETLMSGGAGGGGGSVVGASIYKSTDDQNNMTASTGAKVTFDSTEWDTDSLFSNANDRLVVPTAMGGKWLVSGQVALQGISATSNDAIFAISKNGSANTKVLFRGAILLGGAGDSFSYTFSEVLSLAAADYIELFVNPGAISGIDMRGGAAWTVLQLTRLGS
jgi:hypothetical protein